jgi:hypothetical protein
MPYDNEYNKMLSNEVDALNRKFLLNEKMTLDPRSMVSFEGSGKLEGGFLGFLAKALVPMILPKILGNGMAGGASYECDDSMSEKEEEDQEEGKGMAGGAMYNTMRDKMEGMGKASKPYKKQSEDKYSCGMGMAGGSAFGVGVGSVRDTGEGETVGKNLGMGKSGGKKRGRKSKMGAGKLEIIHHSEGAGVAGGKKRGRKPKMAGKGVISNLGIPIISNIAGLFGLGASGAGASGGARSDPLRPEQFYPKVLAQTAPSADKSVPPAGIVDSAQNIGSSLSGFGKKGKGRSGGVRRQTKKDKEDEKLAMEIKGLKDKEGKGKSGGRKANPWMELMAKVRKEHPELKGVKAVADYIKKNNLYKK